MMIEVWSVLELRLLKLQYTAPFLQSTTTQQPNLNNNDDGVIIEGAEFVVILNICVGIVVLNAGSDIIQRWSASTRPYAVAES